VLSEDTKSSETLVADLGDCAAAVPQDGGLATSTPQAGCSGTESDDLRRPPHSACTGHNNNCSARQAIVRTSQISALLASKNFRW